MEILIDAGKDKRTGLNQKFLLRRFQLDLGSASLYILYQSQIFDLEGNLFSVKDCEINVINIPERSHPEEKEVEPNKFEKVTVVDQKANPVFDIFLQEFGVKSGQLDAITSMIKQYEKIE